MSKVSGSQASFRPKVGLGFSHLVDASEYFKEVFGREIAELEQSVVANIISFYGAG